MNADAQLLPIEVIVGAGLVAMIMLGIALSLATIIGYLLTREVEAMAPELSRNPGAARAPEAVREPVSPAVLA